MRILVIEDNPSVMELFRHFAESDGHALEFASDRDEALGRIEAGPAGIDLAICDLKIPAQRGSMDAEVEHGLRVLQMIISRWPGIPVVVLSAFGTVDVLAGMLLEAKQIDIFGTGVQTPMLRFVQKANLTAVTAIIEAAQLEFDSLNAIELVGASALDEAQRRALRIFARRRGGRTLNYKALSGGLSGAKTGLATVRNESGAQVAHVVAKLTRLDSALEERERYRTYIAGRLGAGTYADLSDEILAGCGDGAGLFYSVADTYDTDLFSVLAKDEARAVEAVNRVAADTAHWTSGAPQVSKTWVDVRRVLIPDEKYAGVQEDHNLANVPDDKAIQTVWAAQHGDLHGANILVDRTGRPVLIDFGRTDDGPSLLDPVTLELAVLFHPDSPFRGSAWPTEEALINWDLLDSYLEGCPYPDFVRACRAWAMRAAAGNRDLLAAVNAFCLRNLMFDDVDSVRALALQNWAASTLASS